MLAKNKVRSDRCETTWVTVRTAQSAFLEGASSCRAELGFGALEPGAIESLELLERFCEGSGSPCFPVGP